MFHNHTIQAKLYVKSLLSCMCPSGGTRVPHAQYSQIERSCPWYHNATSTCQKCSATVFCIGNQLWSIFPAIFLNGCKSLEKSTFFYPHLHAASSPSSDQVAACHPWSLKAVIISFPFPTKASASPTFEQIPQCEREIILWHLRQVGLTGSLLPGRVRASESLVGRSSGDGVRLRKGRGVLRQPICTPTPEPTAVTRGETKERKNRERRGRKKKKL